jgi:acyl-CoA synthetase (AMP-forming)/AMP-acid ligase II
MLGLMQHQALTISSLIDFAERHHGEGQIVSRRVGDRVATLAWNGYRHLELYFGVSRQRPGGAHHQPAPAARPDCLDRQPRRRPGAVLRHDLPAH